MNIDTGINYPAVGQQAYPGGQSPTTESVPVPYNQPDLAPPPCPAYTASPHTGYDGDVAASDNIQVQFLAQSGSQPTAPPVEQQGGAGDQWEEPPDAFADEDAPERRDDGPTQPTETFDPIPGYESIVAYDAVFDIPPPPYEPPSEDSRPAESFSTPDMLTEKVVRDAMLTFVDQECCYGSRPAKQMDINSVKPSSGLHYQLETFTEGRYTKWTHCPYHGGDIDGPHCGRAPLPWEIYCQPLELFFDHEKEVEVPHTSNVRSCFKCCGLGKLTCGKCNGKGKVRCGRCNGRGHTRVKNSHGNGYSNRSCHSCHGSGKKRCSRCSGSGKVTCYMCTGTGRLRHFLQLVVKFTNHLSDYILEESDMPAELIRDVSGQVIFEQSLPHIWPITQYTEQRINDHSIQIVNEHRQAWPQERTLMERQILRSVPVSEVAYQWMDVNTRFWVYGFEHKVYAPDYPHQCCWGCNIL